MCTLLHLFWQLFKGQPLFKQKSVKSTFLFLREERSKTAKLGSKDCLCLCSWTMETYIQKLRISLVHFSCFDMLELKYYRVSQQSLTKASEARIRANLAKFWPQWPLRLSEAVRGQNWKFANLKYFWAQTCLDTL